MRHGQASANRRAARLGDGLGSMEPIPDDTRLHGAFRYVSHDEDTGDKLYNREIQDALAGLAQNAKIDVIGFDACLMSMLETAYALRDQRRGDGGQRRTRAWRRVEL